jgi:drug/metabolite transporter (DMT)-like permease
LQLSVEKKQLLTGLLLSLVTVFFSSTVAAVGKHVSQEVHVSAIVLVQYGISFLFALPSVLRAGRVGLATSRPGLHIIRGVSGCACFYLYYLALSKISLVDATLLRSTAPLMVPLVIYLWFSQRVRKESWPPLVVGFVGVLLVLKPGFAGLSLWHLLALLSGLGLAVSMVSTRVLPFYLWHYEPIPASAWPGLLYMGVVIYLSFVMYTLAYRYVSAAALAPISYFGVVFSGLLDWLIWDHIPDTITLMGIACVVMGGVLVLKHKEVPAPA